MRTKRSLKKTYADFQTFFRTNVQISPCPVDILLQEMRAVVGSRQNKPLDDTMVDRVHVILADVYREYDHSKDKDSPPSWVKPFSELPFLPVRTPTGDVFLRRLHGEHYIADPTGELANLFAGLLPIVAMPIYGNEELLMRFRRLLRSSWFPGAQFLDAVVQRELVGCDDERRTPNVALSQRYQSRVLYLRR